MMFCIKIIDGVGSGKVIPTRRTTGVSDRRLVATPAQTILTKHTESTQTTPRITPPVLHHLEKAEEDRSQPEPQESDDPFGEPKVDEFGTGIGV